MKHPNLLLTTATEGGKKAKICLARTMVSKRHSANSNVAEQDMRMTLSLVIPGTLEGYLRGDDILSK